MTDLIARFLRDITAPVGGAMFRAVIALALVIVALGAVSCALVVANIWLYAWLSTMMTPLQALGVVTGAWLGVALVALVAAWIVLRRSRSTLARSPTPNVQAAAAQAAAAAKAAAAAQVAEATRPMASLAGQIDAMVDPLAKTLTAMGLQKETAAVLAGAQAFKTLRVTQLSALALIVGYTVARSYGRKN